MRLKNILAACIICVLVLTNSVVSADSNVYRSTSDTDISTSDESRLSGEVGVFRYHPNGYFYNLDVSPFRQENSYYCGPATVKTVVDYINGRSESQSYYARRLGTDDKGTYIIDIARVLQEETPYEFSAKRSSSFSDWIRDVQFSLSRNVPLVIDIVARPSDNFKYTTGGHFLAVSGVDARYPDFRVKISDVHYRFCGQFWHDAELIYNLCRNHADENLVVYVKTK